MAALSSLPEGLVCEEGGATGHFDGSWLYEGTGRTRLGIKVKEMLHEESSDYQKLAVYDTGFFGKVLTLDDCVMLTERDEFVYHEMLTHLPLLSMENPRQVLIIGGGDAGCLREALKHPTLERVVQCDIDERVTRVSEQFFPWVTSAIEHPRAEVIFQDGIRYIDEHEGVFDLIIVDSTDPVGPAVGLFLEEFYRKVSRALKPGGVMVAQTESPHWDPAMMGTIYEQMGKAFQHVHAYMGWIPTYPSGCWTWSYASNTRRPDDYFNVDSAALIEKGTHYYNAEIQKAAFALPNFVKRVVQNDNPFARFTR